MDKQTSNKLTEKTTFTPIETETEKNVIDKKNIYIECISSTIGSGCAIDFNLYELCLKNRKYLKNKSVIIASILFIYYAYKININPYLKIIKKFLLFLLLFLLFYLLIIINY